MVFGVIFYFTAPTHAFHPTEPNEPRLHYDRHSRATVPWLGSNRSKFFNKTDAGRKEPGFYTAVEGSGCKMWHPRLPLPMTSNVNSLSQ